MTGIERSDRDKAKAEPDLTYVTRGGVTVRRFRRDADYRTAISDYTGMLDTQPGVILSSNYEYPGRYTRWDTAIVNPPVLISSTRSSWPITIRAPVRPRRMRSRR